MLASVRTHTRIHTRIHHVYSIAFFNICFFLKEKYGFISVCVDISKSKVWIALVGLVMVCVTPNVDFICANNMLEVAKETHTFCASNKVQKSIKSKLVWRFSYAFSYVFYFFTLFALQFPFWKKKRFFFMPRV